MKNIAIRMCLLNLPIWPMGASMMVVVVSVLVAVVEGEVALLDDLVERQQVERMHIQWQIETMEVDDN